MEINPRVINKIFIQSEKINNNLSTVKENLMYKELITNKKKEKRLRKI